MKQNKRVFSKIAGWLFFLAAGILFFGQMGYLILRQRYQFEYIDYRLFYLFNILWAVFLAASLFLLLRLSRKSRWFLFSLMLLFLLVNGWALEKSKLHYHQITSVSPNLRHVVSIKENKDSGEKVFYRSYYRILGRPAETIPYQWSKEVKVDWLAEDVAAVTYRDKERHLQQYVATYGDRGSGISYYYVEPEIRGVWQGENVLLESSREGIAVRANGKVEEFKPEEIEQFGTLAVVLKKGEGAVWTVTLAEDFKAQTDSLQKEGSIILYPATMKDAQPIRLEFLQESSR